MNTLLILENLPLPLFVIDMLTNEILFVNEALTALLHLDQNDLAGKQASFLDSFISDSEGESLIRKIFEFVELDEEIVDIRSSNTIKSLVCRTRIMIQDNFVHAICIFEPVHSLAERMVKNSELLLTKAESHEMRSRLNTIMGLSHVISEESEPEKIKVIAENIMKAGEGILPVFEKREGNKQESEIIVKLAHGAVDVVPLIKTAIQEYVRLIIEKKIHLRFTTFQKIVALKVDAEVFSESFKVFLELAIEATDTGEVKIEIFEKYADTKSIAIIKITDTGTGIKKSYLDLLSVMSHSTEKAEISAADKVYANFIRAKTMIEHIGGEIFVESQWGIGTSISLHFPLPGVAKDQNKPVTEPTAPERVAGVVEKVEFTPEVLMVDDDQMVHHVVKRYLAGRCNMDYAMDGRRALLAAENKHYDIFFLDINLGVGLTGLQVAKRLRQQKEYASTPIVAITAYAMPGDKERALAAGCTYYQSKPFTKAEIILVFNQCLALANAAYLNKSRELP